MAMGKFEKSLYMAFKDNQEKGIKWIEDGLQKAIEEEYKGKCWWEVCNVNIFMELFSGIVPMDLVNKIIASCNEYNEKVGV